MLRGAKQGLARLVLVVVSAAAVSATSTAVAWAGGSNQDAVSRASTVDRNYQRFLTSEKPAVHRAVLTYVAAVNRQCRGVLAPLNSAKPSDVGYNAVLNATAEIGIDVAVAAGRVGRPHDLRFYGAVRRAGWTGGALRTIERYVRVNVAAERLRASRLCADMRAWVTSLKVTPPATRAFIAYAHHVLGNWDPESHFHKLLKRYETTADAATVRKIISVDGQLDGWDQRTITRGAQALLKDLAA